jgi:parallel beta-helix repeat protein
MPILRTHAQKIKIVWDNPSARLVGGDEIYVRPMSSDGETGIQETGEPFYTFVFDESKNNRFNEADSNGRSLFRLWRRQGIPYEAKTFRRDTSLVSESAEFDFLTETQQSQDFPGFAFGYGLYFIAIDFPDPSCTDPNDFLRTIVPISFLDSRFPYSGVDSIVIHFRITNNPFDEQHTRWFPINPDSGGYFRITHPDTIDLFPSNDGWSSSLGFWVFPKIEVHELFQQGAPEYAFHIANDLQTGLKPDERDSLQHLFLTHSVRLHQGVYDLDSNLETLTIDGGYSLHKWGRPIYESDRPVIVEVDGFPEFTGIFYNHFIAKRSGSYSVLFISAPDSIPSAWGGVPSGLRFSSSIQATFSNCELDLSLPVDFHGWTAGSMDPRLTVDSCTLFVTGTSDDVENHRIPRNCGLLLTNVNAKITSSNITGTGTMNPTDVWPQTGIITYGDVIGSRFEGNTIHDLGGHGIEIVNLHPTGGTRIKTSVEAMKILGNTIRNNLMYGIHLRGIDTNPYLRGNDLDSNGYQGGNTQYTQSWKLDAVNVFQSRGVLQENTFRNNGAYGLHASFGAEPKGYDYDAQINPKLQPDVVSDSSRNCFNSNYFTIGENGGSTVHLGDSISPTVFRGHRNEFSSPRAQWHASNQHFHATLKAGSKLLAYRNYWASPDLTQPFGEVFSILDSSDVKATSQIGVSHCGNSFAGGGGISVASLNQQLVDQILAAKESGDWLTVKSLSLSLLSGQFEPSEATLAGSCLRASMAELGDTTIAGSLAQTAVLTGSMPLLYHAVSAYDDIGNHSASMNLAGYAAGLNPYSDDWRLMQLHNAFILNDVMENRNAAEDLLLGILSYFPDDGQTIGAYYSVMAKLPQGYSLKRDVGRPESAPVGITLDPNYPNPFSHSTVIPFSLAVGSNVAIRIFDLLGREARCIPLGYLQSGPHTRTIETGSLTPGLYAYRVETSFGALTRRFVVAR